MAKSKNYYVAKTKEDFDKAFEIVYRNASKEGYRNGVVDTLAKLIFAINDVVDNSEEEDIRIDAEKLADRMKLMEWRKRTDVYETIKTLSDRVKELEEES